MEKRKLLHIIFFLSIIGLVISGYLTYLHYSTLNSPCDFSETLSCSIVNRSAYAEFFGIPVAVMGFIGYSFIGLVSISLSKHTWKLKMREKILFQRILSEKVLFIFSIAALLFSGYLTYAEFFLIKSICVLCILSQLILIIIALVSYTNFRKNTSLISGGTQ